MRPIVMSCALRSLIAALIAVVSLLTATAAAAQTSAPGSAAVPMSADPSLGRAPIPGPAPGPTIQASPELQAAYAQVDEAERALIRARDALETPASAGDADAIRALAERARTRAEAAAAVIDPEQTLLAARLEALGAAPAGQDEAPEILAQRATLQSAFAEADAAAKRAELVKIEASQLMARLDAQKAETEADRVNQRVRSPLSLALWTDAARDLPRLGARLGALKAAVPSGQTTRPWILIVSLGFAVVIAGPVATLLRQLGRRFAHRRGSSDGRLRRSLYAFWMLLVGFLTAGLAAGVLVVGLQISGLLSAPLVMLLSSVVVALFIGAFIVALCEALLLVGQPEWRMIRIDTAEARQLRPFGWAAALATGLATTSDAFIVFVQPPASVATALQALIAALCIGVLLGLLYVVGRIRAREDGVGGFNVFFGRAPTLLLILLWPASLYILYRGALGYVTWSTQTALWLVWGGAVLLTYYLLARLVDDACRAVFSHQTRFARSAHARLGVKDNTLLQFGVLLSAALRLALLVFAAVALFVPFGSGFTSIFDLFAVLARGVHVGEIEISPSALFRAAIVLIVALAIFNLIRRWLVESYLPTTSLDAGAVNSIGVVTGYLGVAAAVLWSLAAFGVRVQQLAFMVSALSVGIGFGLQAITQNFVSGLILLAERPIRIGDRVKIGDQTGRVARISVRATQVVADDGSHLVVPNSELITKTVETVAAANPGAAVLIRGETPVAVHADLDAVRDLLITAAQRHPAVASTPPPAAYVREVRETSIVFAWTATLKDVSDADQVRGEILLAIVQALRADGAASISSGQPAKSSRPRPSKRRTA